MTPLVPYLRATGALQSPRRRRKPGAPVCPYDRRPCRRPRCSACSRGLWLVIPDGPAFVIAALGCGVLLGWAL